MSNNKGIVLELYNPDTTYHQQKRFDCEHKKINRFVVSSLKKQVRQNLSQAYVLVDSSENNRFIGFYTLSSFSIDAGLMNKLSENSLPSRIPCVRLIMLGVDNQYKKRGLGKLLLQNALLKTSQIAPQLGIYGLYLDTDPDAYTFYVAHGFMALQLYNALKPTPMFLHIETLKAALS